MLFFITSEDAKVKKNEDSLHTPFLLCLTMNLLCLRQDVPCWPFLLDFLLGMSLEKETTMDSNSDESYKDLPVAKKPEPWHT